MASSTEFLKISGREFEKTLGDSEGQGSWHAAVHGVEMSRTWLSDWKQQLDVHMPSA